MVATKYMLDGTDSTGDLSLISSTSGTITSATDQSHTGSRSLKCVNGGQANINGVLADAGRRITFWFRFDGLPSTDALFVVINAAGANCYNIFLTSTGAIKVSGASTGTATSTTTLAAATWHRVCVSYTITNATTNSLKLYLNGGAAEFTITNANIIQAGSSGLLLVTPVANGSFSTAWFDDIYVDDSTALTDPGDVRVTCKRPAALNTNNFDTLGGSGTNRYDRVSEVPISETNYIQHAAATDVQENFGLQTASQGDVNIASANLIARQAWIWAKASAYPTPTFGTAGSGTRFTASTSPVTQAFTAGSTTTLIVLMIVTDGAVARAGGAPTYNGNTMTQAGSTQGANASFETTVEMFYLIGSNDGSAHNFSIPNTGSKTLYFNCATFIPISGTTFSYDSGSIQQGTNTGAADPSHTITPTAGGAVIVQVLGDGRLTAPTANTGTLISANDEGSFSDSYQYVLQGAAAAVAVGWTCASDDWCMVTAAFIPTVSQGGAAAAKIMDNGTETAVALTTTSALYSVLTDSTSYPSNAAGIGMRSTGNSQDTYFYEGGTMIAYTPGTAFTPPLPVVVRQAVARAAYY